MAPTPHEGVSPAATGAPGAAQGGEGPPDARGLRWLSVVLPPLVAALMLGLTFLYWQSGERGAQAKREQNFQVAADQAASNLRDRMATYEVVLRGVKGYFEGSEHIDRAEFHAYVEALQIQQTRPGLKGISLLQRLPADRLEAHVADMRAGGLPAYHVRPEGKRPAYAPITHIEPFAGENLQALGFDAMTLPAARDALQRARDTGTLALSGPLALLQDGGPGGLVMYLPIYGAGADLRTPEGRRAALVGWVSAPFRLPDVVRGMARELDPDIALQIVDSTDGNPAAGERLLDSTDTGTGAGTGAAPSASGMDGAVALETTRVLDFGGRRWTLRITPLPAFEERHQEGTHRAVAVLGTALSLLLAWFAWLLATGRERAVALARTMTAELRAARDELQSTINAIPDRLLELDLDGRIHRYYTNRSGRSVPPRQQPDEKLLGQRVDDLLAPDAAASCHAALQAAHAAGYSSGHQYRLEANGAVHWFELSVARKENAAPGAGPRFIALSRDITERKLAEERTHQLAYFDSLTGLPNRRLLIDRMEEALRSAQDTAQVGALLYIDLDNFKQINDARGHSLGDLLLMQVAQRLTQLQRPGDTVAHLGGDEFVVLVHSAAGDMESAGRVALQLAEEVRAALEAAYTIDTHLYSSTASIGITLFPKRGEGVEDLLREADTAMYRAKDLGRNRIRFYESAMQADVQERMALEQDLKKAQAAGQLSAFVQSQVDASGAVVGGELLMRWNHPQRGNVPPARFIPVAESSGLILRMGDWMIQQACETLARLQAAGKPLSLSVNVSQRQFRQDDFVERVRHVLAHTGADPAHLILEVTESLLIENLDDTIARMTEIERLGVRFSIDDFGTGYSSLAYLKRLPLYELKIDKSFVQDTPDDPNDTAIVQSILSVARHLDLRVVAEGVETRAQADFLAASQCDCLQGYLFGRPEPLPAWLARQLPG